MGGRLSLTETTGAWRAVAATAPGSSHRDRGEPGQDAVRVEYCDDGRVVVAVADGAGSAPLAAEGSAAAVEAAAAVLLDGACVEDAFEAAAAALGDDAATRATTLLLARLDPSSLEFGQVGDGFAVVRATHGYEVVNPTPDREYLNETVFLSSSGWRDDLRLTVLPADAIDAVALMTDGVQLVAFEIATASPFAGFFDPLFAWAASDGAGASELRAFLSSPRLAERTDDDVTIALALRVP